MSKLSVVMMGLALSACASTLPQQRVQSVGDMPMWYVNVPTDEKKIYASGTASAPDIQFAVDIATINAKVVMADRLDSRLSGQIKQYNETVGTKLLKDTSKTIRNVIAEADVAGYKRDKLVVIPEGSEYRAYVLLTYSEDEAFKVLNYRMQMNKDGRVDEAFDELDKVITGPVASVATQ